MSIYYCAIARQDTILTSHQSDQFPVNLDDLMKIGMSEVSSAVNSRHVVTVGNNLLLHILIDNKLLFACIADPAAGRWLPFQFITEVIKKFKHSSLSSRAELAESHEFNSDFAWVLADHIVGYSMGKQSDRLAHLQWQVEDVRGVINENVTKVLDRADGLEDLLVKTRNLEETAVKFRSTAQRTRTKIQCKNLKLLMTLLVIGTSFITLAILFAVGIIPTS